MAPSPISSHFDSGFEIDVQTEMLLRARWEGRDFDPKVVGSHLTLSKRNSTPLSCGLTASIQNGLKNAIANQQLASIKNAILPHGSESMQNVHRKLDRSFSEPVRAQTQPSQVTTGASRYKTELCRPFAETGKCKYSDKCQFAHGLEELRSMTRHPKYKTELCRTFHSTGLCGYGTRCHFIHNEDERRSPSGVSPPPSVGSPMGINCRPLGPLSYVTPEEYAVGTTPTYNVGQSPFSNESMTFNGQSSYSEQSPKHFTSGPTSPSFSIGRSSSDSFGHTPPQVSPTSSESSFFNPLFSQKETFGPITHSPPLPLSSSVMINELSTTIFNDNLSQFEESTIDHINVSLGCKLPESPEPPIIPYGMRDPTNSGLRLPIFKNLTKV